MRHGGLGHKNQLNAAPKSTAQPSGYFNANPFNSSGFNAQNVTQQAVSQDASELKQDSCLK